MEVLPTRELRPAVQARSLAGRKPGTGKQATRLLHITQTLQEPGKRYTLEELANKFSISTRTVRRDLKILEASGVKVIKHGDFLWSENTIVKKHEVALNLVRTIMGESEDPRLSLAYAWLQGKPVSVALIQAALSRTHPFGSSAQTYEQLKSLTKGQSHANAA